MGLEVVRRLVQEVWNDRRFELLPELFADPFDHGGRVDTVAGIKQWHADDARIWADTRYQVVREVGGADQVAIQWRATARQVGQWGPVPPSGREISWDGVHFFTL
ncbi:MAG TPA: hypothetical protein DGT23_05720, partial [Micromonosporaceae bacterium]|nr:hypothetical protein [Micromonosporaceae bacterium]